MNCGAANGILASAVEHIQEVTRQFEPGRTTFPGILLARNLKEWNIPGLHLRFSFSALVRNAEGHRSTVAILVSSLSR
jgi:hypothetical protein